MRITRRSLQVGLGVLWLLDGALQCQQFMFTRAFARTELAPAANGQPALVAHTVHWVSGAVASHPVLSNSGFAAIQLGLGIGLLWKRSARWALAASVLWGVAVWWLGEGIGGLSGGATLQTGAPGAALLYAVIALLAWPTRTGDSSAPPSRWALPTWSALWLMGAALQVVAGSDTGRSFDATLTDSAAASPRWIGQIDGYLLRQHISSTAVAVLIAIEVIVAMWVLVPGRVRQLSVLLGTAIALSSWLVVQGLGDLTSGRATDPNSGPLIALLALAVLGTKGQWPERSWERNLGSVPIVQRA